eukprot:CAMPEP_0174365780 /NCGR_PEP_ID=MMETSP0811_2-20130205/78479_1 /TAXON_ID=73025 ORGANISM="Eutreptiella gymnastica-like, Strain CCMP1594" /NCGR_SAMPLE_ID=MMETSP0811_2 /ASSEMBLY_ACC=CAM_ASM_000667 /LENGTH=69 /DNA_ID=CAMNT_0015506711 /DNA_START=365 /DNA_END=571 /DNA_ORIENTATION=-
MPAWPASSASQLSAAAAAAAVAVAVSQPAVCQDRTTGALLCTPVAWFLLADYVSLYLVEFFLPVFCISL